MNPDTNSNKRNNVISILLLLLLVGSVGFNIYQYQKSNNEKEELNLEIFESAELRELLESELNTKKLELEEFKSENQKLDQLISEKEQELLDRKKEIEKLLTQSKISYNKYISIKEKIDEYKFLADKYLKEIEKLSEENKRLATENEKLATDNKEKNKKIENLTDENILLNNKVALAARLLTDNIVVETNRLNNSGKERETDRAKYVEQFKFCFDLPQNYAARQGEREVYVQILNPKGETISIESAGSGVADLIDGKTQYTSKHKLNYDLEAAQFCYYWKKPNSYDLPAGQYKLVLITEGYVMGEKSFKLK
jgi:hypothetical protein